MMNPEYEVDPKDAARRRNIALACREHLQELLKNEESQGDSVGPGNWASRQYNEFDTWCDRNGVDDEDVRLKGDPLTYKSHVYLLKSLEDNLRELQQSFGAPEHVVNIDDNVDDAQSDSFSPYFSSDESESDSESESEAECASSASEKRNAWLRKRIQDTIHRLYGREYNRKKTESHIIENAKGVFTWARLLVNQGVELERKGITQDAIMEEMNKLRPSLKLLERLPRYSITINEAIVQFLVDLNSETFCEGANGQTLLSWTESKGYKAAVKLLLDKEPKTESTILPCVTPTASLTAVVTQDDIEPLPVLPMFLSLPQEDIGKKFLELAAAERVRETDLPKYKQSDGRMDRVEGHRPWAHNRVQLHVPENKYDYVNASPITLTSSSPNQPPLHYIAMQGPTEPSFDHVWRMIAEQTPSSTSVVIVQLTEMGALGQSCAQYFPTHEGNATWTFNDDNIWGDNWKAHLTFSSREVIAGGAIEKSKLVLRVYKEGGEKETHVIWHFLYKRWPDFFGVPIGNNLDSLLQLIKLSEQHSSPLSKRIVHCSAGVGRTGTFIALDHLIRELNLGVLERFDEPSEGPDLICNTVDTLRQQRCSMVQSEEQYRFIYQVMRKLWYNKYGVADEKASNNK